MSKDGPADRPLVTESGIPKPADVKTMRDAGVHAFLVGEAFMRRLTTRPGAKFVWFDGDQSPSFFDSCWRIAITCGIGLFRQRIPLKCRRATPDGRTRRLAGGPGLAALGGRLFARRAWAGTAQLLQARLQARAAIFPPQPLRAGA